MIAQATREALNRYVNLLPEPAARRYGAAYVAWLDNGAVGYAPDPLRLPRARAEAIRAAIALLDPWGR